MIGVVVPAHNEEALIARALRALQRSAQHGELAGEQVEILVVLDACSDGTVAIVQDLGIEHLSIEACNVGIARATGAQALIQRGARWLAFTDADSAVAPSWLARQLGLRTDAVCGVVEVDDWHGYSHEERCAYEAHYVDAEGHRHVHGANLGVCSRAYMRAGGFPPTASREDVGLVQRLVAAGATIAWTNTVRVITSARRVGRAPMGHAHFMQQLQQA